MTTQSTNKMLEKMLGGNQSLVDSSTPTANDELNSDHHPKAPSATPKLAPTPDMEHVLSQILGNTSEKNQTPME
jgi:hypothetical protein